MSTSRVPKRDLPHNLPPIAAELSELSRTPFVAELSDWLGTKPTRAALQKFANRFPDRWVNGISALAKLVGYADKSETTHNINITLAARLQTARGRDAIDAMPASAVVPLTLAAPLAATHDEPTNITATYTDVPYKDDCTPSERIEMPRDDAKPAPRIPLTTARNET